MHNGQYRTEHPNVIKTSSVIKLISLVASPIIINLDVPYHPAREYLWYLIKIMTFSKFKYLANDKALNKPSHVSILFSEASIFYYRYSK